MLSPALGGVTPELNQARLLRRLRSLCSTMDSVMQVAQLRLKALPIFFPPHSVHSRRSLFLQAVITIPEQIHVHVVQQSSEL